ncbi:protein AMN1 homolog isoform 1-T2 [Synchiropus picturatus]
MNHSAGTNNHLWSNNFNINEQQNLAYMYHNGQPRNQQFNQQINYHTQNNQHQIGANNVTLQKRVPKIMLRGSMVNNRVQWKAHCPTQTQDSIRGTAPPQGHGYSYSTPVYDWQPRQAVGPTTQEAMHQQRYIQEHTSRAHVPPPAVSAAPSSSHSIQMAATQYAPPNRSLNTAPLSIHPPSYMMSLLKSRMNDKVTTALSHSRTVNQMNQANPQLQTILTTPPTKNMYAPKPPSYNSCSGKGKYKNNLNAKVPLLNPVTETIQCLQTVGAPLGGPQTPVNTPIHNQVGNILDAQPQTLPIDLNATECCLSSTSSNKVVAVVPPMSPIQPTVSESPDQIQKKQILHLSDSARPNSNSPPVDTSVSTCGFTPTEDLTVPVTPTERSLAPELKDRISNAVVRKSLEGATEWTAEALERLVQSACEENTHECSDVLQKIINLYWDGSMNRLLKSLKPTNHRAFVEEIVKFCCYTVKPDTVICRSVDDHYLKQPLRFHVLKDNEVYTEAPYTSSWLNMNENLDDIDKEFGFPPKHHFLPRKVEVPPEPHSSSVKIPSETLQQPESRPEETRDTSTDETPPDENPPMDSDSKEVKIDPPTEPLTLPTPEPADRPETSPECIEENDPTYGLGIEVMSPSEARAIFEQSLRATAPTPERENQSEEEAPVEENDEPKCTEEVEIIDLCDDDELVEDKVPKIEQVCCIAKWKQLFQGPSESACACECKLPKEEQKAHLEIDNKEFHKTLEGSHVISIDWPNMAEVIDITDSWDDCPNSDSLAEEPSEPEQADVKSDLLVQTHSLEQPADSHSNSESTEADLGSDDDAFGETSTCGTSQEASPVPSQHDEPERKHATQAPVHDEQTTSKRKITHEDENNPMPAKIQKTKTLERLSRRVQKISKLRNMDSEEPIAEEIQTAQLVLYGSQPKGKCADGDNVQRLTLSGCVDFKKPPKVVSVKFHKNKGGKSSKKHSSDMRHLDQSPKKSEKPLKKVRFDLHKDSPKMKDSRKQSPIRPFLVSTPISSSTQHVNKGKSEDAHVKHKKSPQRSDADVSVSERRFKGAEKRLKRLKKKLAYSNSVKSPDKDIYSPKLLSRRGRGSDTSSPAPKHTLKFSVLPESFSFNDGSSSTRDSPKAGHKPEADKQDKGASFSRERKVGTGGLKNKKPKPPCTPTQPWGLRKKHRQKHPLLLC